jgi:hypothetical protein
MKLQRWRLMFNNGAWCKSEDVAELEAKCAELEAKCAELEAKCARIGNLMRRKRHD